MTNVRTNVHGPCGLSQSWHLEEPEKQHESDNIWLRLYSTCRRYWHTNIFSLVGNISISAKCLFAHAYGYSMKMEANRLTPGVLTTLCVKEKLERTMKGTLLIGCSYIWSIILLVIDALCDMKWCNRFVPKVFTFDLILYHKDSILTMWFFGKRRHICIFEMDGVYVHAWLYKQM